jgi:hypothetical protein
MQIRGKKAKLSLGGSGGGAFIGSLRVETVLEGRFPENSWEQIDIYACFETLSIYIINVE